MALHGLIPDEQPVSDEPRLFVKPEIINHILIGNGGDAEDLFRNRTAFPGTPCINPLSAPRVTGRNRTEGTVIPFQAQGMGVGDPQGILICFYAEKCVFHTGDDIPHRHGPAVRSEKHVADFHILCRKQAHRCKEEGIPGNTSPLVKQPLHLHLRRIRTLVLILGYDTDITVFVCAP